MSDNGKSYALYEALQENDQLRARVAEQQAALESICTFSWGAGEPFDAGRAASRMQEVAELAIDDVPRTQAFILRKQAEAVQASRRAISSCSEIPNSSGHASRQVDVALACAYCGGAEKQAVSVPQQWRDTMEELAADLESEIENRRSGDLDRRIERDLIVVREARALLAEQEQGDE